MMETLKNVAETMLWLLAWVVGLVGVLLYALVASGFLRFVHVKSRGRRFIR